MRVYPPDGSAAKPRHVGQALRNTVEGRRVFQFADPIQLLVGDLLQEEGAENVWKVTEVDDHVHAGTFVKRHAFVAPAAGAGGLPVQPHTSVTIGSIVGGVQVASPGSTQTVTVAAEPTVVAALAELRRLVADSDLDEFDREDAQHLVTQVESLAARPPSDKARLKINEKLAAVVSAITISEKLRDAATPLIGRLAELLGVK